MAIRKTKRGYQVRYPHHRSNGKIVYRLKTLKSKSKAKKFKNKMISEFEDRELFGITHQEQKMKDWDVSQLLDWFLELDYVNCVDRSEPLKRYFGDKNIYLLNQEDVKTYRSWRSRQRARRNQSLCEHTVKSASINREVALLRQAYNEANIQPNPCKGVKALKEQPRDRVLTRAEFGALQAELEGDARDIVTIAYYTGLRKGEIFCLDDGRVDVVNGYFNLKAEDTKNGEARKVPFMSVEVWDIFRRRKNSGLVFGCLSIRTAFEGACRRSGIKDFRFHDLRHTAATNMRKAGIDTPTVMKICGWKSVAMFLRYQNVGTEDLEKASVALASNHSPPPLINVRRPAEILEERL